VPRNPTPSGGPGYYSTIGDRQVRDNGEPLHPAMAYVRDTRRRATAWRLVAEGGRHGSDGDRIRAVVLGRVARSSGTATASRSPHRGWLRCLELGQQPPVERGRLRLRLGWRLALRAAHLLQGLAQVALLPDQA
jgi:hypothetical protein